MFFDTWGSSAIIFWFNNSFLALMVDSKTTHFGERNAAESVCAMFVWVFPLFHDEVYLITLIHVIT